MRGLEQAACSGVRACQRVLELGNAELHQRLHVIEGDLSTNLAWLQQSELFAHGRLDAVIHSAAQVSSVLPYAALKAANVDLTTVLLELALRRDVPFVFVSSTSAVTSTHQPVEEAFITPYQDFHSLSGYGQSKAVAEVRVRAASQCASPRGRMLILRLGLVGACAEPSTSGAASYCNPSDWLCAWMRACVDLAALPEVPCVCL